jgi:thiol:disulfide interchange protein
MFSRVPTAILHRLMLAFALLAIAAPAPAQLAQRERNAIASQLVAESDAPAAGSEVALALVMKPDPGWHGYWQNPGDAGQPMRIAWRLPAGVEAGPLQFPVPGRLMISGLMNYVYEGEHAPLTTLRIPAGLPVGARLPVAATVDYLACTDRICVPERADVALTLTVGAPGAPLARRAQFDGYRQALPRPLGSEGRFERAGDRLRLAVPLPQAMPVEDAYFFPLTEKVIDYAAPQAVSRSGDRLVVETAAGKDASGAEAIEGVLRIGEDQGLSLIARAGDVPAAGIPLGAPGEGQPRRGWSLLLTALAGAIVGGMLLNIMPCVFPILSLKAMTLVRAGEDEAGARREALAYTAGVVLTCLALGGVLLALRAGGEAVGWAFQLQDPRVILFLFVLVLAIALNLAGLFELPAITGGGGLTAREGAAGAFWTGALAAFVATPCTGPFMGAALGAALVLPGAAALAIFAGLGLGLALPFLALGFVPALRRRLPRPGPWMTRFRHWMSLPMFLTAAGLAWILSRQSGTEGLLVAAAAGLLVALALWLVGRRQGRDRAWLPLAPAAAAVVAALLVVPAATAPASAEAGAVLGAEPFSEARLAALQREGRPVFVYFTADWCVTCKVNEKAVLDRDEVARAFADGRVAVLVGDWTRGDAAISRFLERHGRSGVPLYLYYAPGKPVQVLPQLLTVGSVTALVA